MEQLITMREALEKRRSVRSYDMNALDAETLGSLKAFIDSVKPLYEDEPYAWAVAGPDEIKTILRWRAPHYLALFCNDTQKGRTNIGFIFEQVVLYLTSLGIGTCWLGMAAVRDPEKYSDLKPAITISFGREAEGNPWNTTGKCVRKEPGKLMDRTDSRLLLSLKAPSAVNSQPWYFVHSNDQVDVYCSLSLMNAHIRDMNLIDIGIILAHIRTDAPEEFRFSVREQPPVRKGYRYIGTLY
ncbi:MAG: hypothetical protein K6D03_05460 [Solobacterium sp.]|nr:hypothetical protein [Solobacterium sp.]